MVRDYYIFKSGRLRRNDNTIEFEISTGEKKSIPVNDVYSIHLFGEVDLNTKVIVFLNQQGIPIHFYNYYGYYSGSFYPREKLLSGFLTVKQVEHYLDLQKRLAIAKELVNTAIHNILANLKHYEKSGKDLDHYIESIMKELDALVTAKEIPELMGIEGRSRNIYYATFKYFLRQEFEFDKRTRMPPNNMLNSLISFGNSLMYSSVLTDISYSANPYCNLSSRAW